MAYKTWKTKEETQSGLKVKQFHADNAAEYKSDGFTELHTKNETIATFSAPYTPAQNGRAERINRTIVEKTRALLFQAKLPKTYWGEAVKAAEYLYNRTPHLALKNMTLFKLKYDQKPDISNIRV